MLECTSCTSIGWGTAGECNFAGKDLRVLEGHESLRILQHLHAVEVSSILGGGSMRVVGRSREMILLPLLYTSRTASGLLCLHWGFLIGKRLLASWKKSSGAAKMLEGLENVTSEERLTERGLFSIKMSSDLVAV